MLRRRTWICGLIAGSLLACSDANDGQQSGASTAGSGAAGGSTAGTVAAGSGASGAGTSGAAAANTAGDTASGSAGMRAPSTGGSAGSAGMRGPQAGRGSRGGNGPAAGSGMGGSAARAGAGGASGRAAASGSGAGAGGSRSEPCPLQGAISYELARSSSPTADEQAAYDRITTAMDRALEIYNCYTNFTWKIRVSYVPSVQTADGNVNGAIRFGSTDSMNYITAMHETSHTLGVGGPKYQTFIVDGIFTGMQATQELRTLTGDASAELHGDNQHFWPYGLNYTSEVKGMEDLIRHCDIVTAMRKDLGL